MSLRCSGVARQLAAGLAVAVVPWSASPASAASSTFDVTDQAVVQIWARKDSDVAVHTWDRSAIMVETDDENAGFVRRPLAFGTPQNPMSVTIPVATIRVREASGAIGSATLPSEDFPYAADMRAGNHDLIRITSAEGSHTTVTIPATAAIVDVRIFGAGNIAIANVHGGTLFVTSGSGRTAFDNVSGSAFVQTLNGRFSAVDSSFDRLRVRGNTVGMLFERCRAKQIEATTFSGPIIFDNGTFDGGLARFESTTGSIAIGTAGSAQLAGRSQDGRVLGIWEHRTVMEQRAENDALATVGGGGSLVNAVTVQGNVLLYDGSLATKRGLPPEWLRIANVLRSPPRAVAPQEVPQRLPTEPPGGVRPSPEHRPVPLKKLADSR